MADRAAVGDPRTVVLLGAGQSVHVRRWATALAARGHRVVVTSWLPADPLPDVDIRSPGTAGGVGGPAGRVWRMLRTARWLRREIRRIAPEVVHVHSVGRAGLLSLAVPRTTARVVTPWGSELRFASRSRWRARVARSALRRAALVVPTSRSVAGEVVDRYGVPASRAVTVSWGVDDEFLRMRDGVDRAAVRAGLGVPADARVVLSMRGAGQVYRTDDILRAFAAAAPDQPDLHLVVLAGHEPADAAAASARAECLGRVRAAVAALPGRITLVDRTLPPADVFRLMRASDVAVSTPSWDQRSSAVLEAALAGCRLLLADLPPYREMIADGLVAELLEDPLADRLASRLAAAGPLPLAEQQRNRSFIEDSELWSRQVEVMRGLYRLIAETPSGLPAAVPAPSCLPVRPADRPGMW
ncbi:glycosyltransferase family 4 protein [Micromonospora chaiyaphumensis]|uniref:Glycosyltransferase involved in cell wall bisynthesis n=1 Tax=Micromonospora chaiyaphumensis TaxID=307119 RepID=A0A1C4X619_9ACTN|nr:glycosyltransferase family 4 protein [Micromonospora chaiyaphumensis]SCF03916.1 Glycosyltransferase involved in cell wall bisynthesis [Micromonospora chaiyaphumensis]